MFDVSKISLELEGLVGIRQPSNPTYQKLDTANMASRSGLFIDDIPQFKMEFFIDNVDYKDVTDAVLNDTIRNIMSASLISVCNRVFNKPSFIDRNYLYSHTTTRENVETTLKNGFIGYEIEPSRTKDVAFKITNVRLEFQGTGNVEILLFDSSEVLPIESKVVSITSESQLEKLDWVVNNTKGFKGSYYFGYVYDGTLVPFKRDYESSNIQNYLSELDIQKVLSIGSDGSQLFSLSGLEYISENIGLNPDITVYDDYTDLIIQNEHLFAEALQMQTAITMMQRYVSSLRSNRNERISKDVLFMTMQQIEGSGRESSIRVVGLNSLMNSEIKRIQKVIKTIHNGYFGSGVQVQTLG